ncbi:unnamed protein product [Paramecium primaurelia]|uniref:Sphingomyelin phosphodiesterase n=1 Tax=Paramecium primaurelia TaxID=5886 RepID=A0A8S1LZQ1_PARPR|nr:unnamed protein product [Paramecium primaurelia]
MNKYIILLILCSICFSSSLSQQEKFFCKQCHKFVHTIQKVEHFWDKSIVWFLELVAEGYCSYAKIEKHSVCKGAIHEMTPVIFEGIQTRFLDEDFICPLIRWCPKVYEELKLEDYVSNILKDKPLNTQWPEIDGTDTIEIIHVSDIHTDLFYKEGSAQNCDEPLCCREGFKLKDYNPKKAGYWGSAAVCDLPERTFEQFVNFLKTDVINPNKKTFLFWTGDNVQHDVWKQGREYNIINSKRITEIFKKANLGIPIIPQVGNHEMFPVDQYDYMTEKDSNLRVEFSNMWRDWLGDETAEFFKKNGFYAKEFDNLKVIAFDSQICNPDNWYLLKDPTDPTGFLEWAEQELKDSELKDQAVYFTAHIFTQECMVPWARRFNALVERYAYIVRGQIYGHAHGEFYNLYKDQNGKPMNIAYISSSLTTYNNKLPSFRKFIVDAKTMIPLNYYEYRLNLDKYNYIGKDAILKWDIAFDFLSEYGVTRMYPSDLYAITERLFTEPELVKKFDFNQNSGTGLSGDTAQYLYCLLNNSIKDDLKVCKGETLTKDWTQYISPGWRKRIDTSGEKEEKKQKKQQKKQKKQKK